MELPDFFALHQPLPTDDVCIFQRMLSSFFHCFCLTLPRSPGRAEKHKCFHYQQQLMFQTFLIHFIRFCSLKRCSLATSHNNKIYLMWWNRKSSQSALFCFYFPSTHPRTALECCENSEGFSFPYDVSLHTKHRKQRRWLSKNKRESQNILQRTSGVDLT